MGKLAKIGEGQYSEAFLYDANYVLLVGKKDAPRVIYPRVKSNLDFLNGKIKSITIPKCIKLFEPCSEYPYGALLISRMHGVELGKQLQSCTEQQKQAIGQKLGNYIDELQEIGVACVSELEKMGIVSAKDKYIENEKLTLSKSIEVLKSYINKSEYQNLLQIEKRYHGFLKTAKLALVHYGIEPFVDENNNLIGTVDVDILEYTFPEYSFTGIARTDKTIFDSAVKQFNGKIDFEDVKFLGLVRAIRNFLGVHLYGTPAQIERKLGHFRSALQ